MKKTGVCPKCGGTKIIIDAKAKARNIVYVCTACGFIETYASEKQIKLLIDLHNKGKL